MKWRPARRDSPFAIDPGGRLVRRAATVTTLVLLVGAGSVTKVGLDHGSITFVTDDYPPHREPQAPRRRVRAQGDEATLACIREIESGGDYAERDNRTYRGAYQFDHDSWVEVGGQGDPAKAPSEEQDARARMLLRNRGLQPWPEPQRRCGW